MSKEINAITKLYDYILWMIPKIDKFPRNQRFIVGDRIENLLLDILGILIEAAYFREKSRLLNSANIKVEQLRYLIRISKDIKLINIKSYEQSARAIDNVGKSIGGRLR